MSYESTVWKAGDTVTSAKLNKLEQGVADVSDAFVVNIFGGRLDKTWREIYEGNYYFIASRFNNYKVIQLITNVGIDNDEYYVSSGNNVRYTADDIDGYPLLPVV